MIISASIVTYKTNHNELLKCIDSLRKNDITPIYISDNSPNDELKEFCSNIKGVIYFYNNGNIGYGAAHNVAMRKAQLIKANYHLVINSDVYFENGIIQRIIDYMEKKHVKKVNGARPGFVIYHTNYSLVIDSDISNLKAIQD